MATVSQTVLSGSRGAGGYLAAVWRRRRRGHPNRHSSRLRAGRSTDIRIERSASAALSMVAEDSRSTPGVVYLWCESRAETKNVLVAWILPLRPIVAPLQWTT